jgi:hypothetical protein
MLTDTHVQEARSMGIDAATNAASWVVNGNTSDDHIRRVLQLMEDCDPFADDYLPRYPDLSGEFAGDYTPLTLARDILDADDPSAEDIDTLADAWEDGVSETFYSACESILREYDTSEDDCTDHGHDVCPDCGNGGIVVGKDGYAHCTRFRTCWAD